MATMLAASMPCVVLHIPSPPLSGSALNAEKCDNPKSSIASLISWAFCCAVVVNVFSNRVCDVDVVDVDAMGSTCLILSEHKEPRPKVPTLTYVPSSTRTLPQ